MSRGYFKSEREEQRAYFRAVKVRRGTTVYLAGIGAPTDAEGNSLAGNFIGQTHRVFARLRETMELVGGTLDDIVTMTPDLRARPPPTRRGSPGSAN
jgi:enamine deaminase RidA (YjgF/YER057c/UK114 family)